MAVGTGAISLSEVIAEISGASGSLQSCVDNYLAAGMNDTYWTSKPSDPVSLAEFRGYSDVCTSVRSFPFRDNGGAGWTSSTAACSGAGASREITAWHDGAGSIVVNGDKVYTDSSGCTVKNGAGRWFIQRDGGTFYRFTVSSLGVVGSVAVC